MKNFKRNIFKKLFLIGTAIQGFMTTVNVNAGALEGTKLVQGTKNLIADGTVVLVSLEAAVVGFLFIKELVQYKTGEEDEKPRHKKAAKTVIIIGIIVVTATGTIGALFSYFL